MQAIQALNRARALDENHPELHVRLVHYKKIGKRAQPSAQLEVLKCTMRSVSSLAQEPPSPIGLVISQSLSKLLPAEVTLDTFNSQYLQRHPASPRATFAFAKALKILDASVDEVESSLFGLLHPEANLDIKVSAR